MSNIKPIEVKYIILKLRDPFFAKSVLERIRKIPGVVSVEQKFPDNVDVSLQKVCLMKVESSAVGQVLTKLQKDKGLESAYQAGTPRLTN